MNRNSIDRSGSAISGVRLDPDKAYKDILPLLKCYLETNDPSAWKGITQHIDYLYSFINCLLTCLDQETHFTKTVCKQVGSGKKLLFKPNLVQPAAMTPFTHTEMIGAKTCTPWPLVAAVMRWFHDKLNICYSQMALGEGSASIHITTVSFSHYLNQKLTPEALIEGAYDDHSMGWGFYFVRQYLSQHADLTNPRDNPLNGLDESLSGTYIPPGKADTKLMVYDLNNLYDDPKRGRNVPVPNHANFPSITLHKVIVGGASEDPEDMADYPGCVLISIAKLKMHNIDIITNALKNLGIGLYPSRLPQETNETSWKYAYPSHSLPNLKGKLPHSPWMIQLDEETHLPVKDKNGNYIATKTAGMTGTQLDLHAALRQQDIFIVHISDAINILNYAHDNENATPTPEGYLWASLDPVALDLFCARYCFNHLPLKEGLELKRRYGWPTEFAGSVPLPVCRGSNIFTSSTFDSPLFRYKLYDVAQKRRIGQKLYYITGFDAIHHAPLASSLGHLGYITSDCFIESITSHHYYSFHSILYHLQKTCLSYAKLSDKLTHTSLYQQILEVFDENHDGIIDYDERGRTGESSIYPLIAYFYTLAAASPQGELQQTFLSGGFSHKYANPDWNTEQHDFTLFIIIICWLRIAYQLSQEPEQKPDRFIPHMIYGEGYWPSLLTVRQVSVLKSLYGSLTRSDIAATSMYGSAFTYADQLLGESHYSKSFTPIQTYLADISEGSTPLNFTLYVPFGFGHLDNLPLPNVVETTDPDKLFCATFVTQDKTIHWRYSS